MSTALNMHRMTRGSKMFVSQSSTSPLAEPEMDV